MEDVLISDRELFHISKDANNIVTIWPDTAVDQAKLGLLYVLESFATLMTSLLKEKNGIVGISYTCPLLASKDYYEELFESAKEEAFESRVQKVLELSTIIATTDRPVVAIIDQSCNSFQLASMLWAGYLIATEKARISLADSKLGIFPGIGVTVYTARLMEVSKATDLLVRSIHFTAVQASAVGLFSLVATDSDDAFVKAKEWILSNQVVVRQDEKLFFDEKDFEVQMAPVRKKTNSLFPGISPCITLIGESKKLPLQEALKIESKRFAEVLSSKEALGIMRTMHYGILNAKDPKRIAGFPEYVFNKIGVLGAGMMGAGIAYEVARTGITVCLKDTGIALAIKGKTYGEKCCDRLIQLGKMTMGKKEDLLSLILPSDNVQDLSGSDLIIEAVFENKDLKGQVIAESSPFLKSDGFFASNTTSLPITDLASFTPWEENFIGMHFFSPVDRMPLVEIIRGKHTSDETLSKAVQLSLKLQKTPIVVHDSPAFFTSRIFFNYLLEAITMILEGIPAANIESQAVKAGFAVSPLAVLDEISIPLMLHVYDQLPELTPSQKRCYHYLSNLTAAGRTGRKSGKGFYTYETGTGKKQIWRDETLTSSSHQVDSQTIQKRLLHVMSLDSYRCLDEGVLDQPIDGDIGSILGVGYAAHTGGVFAHIDATGIGQFVKDCQSFHPFGEQWNVPPFLQKLAEQDYSFYNGFKSNWPVAK